MNTYSDDKMKWYEFPLKNWHLYLVHVRDEQTKIEKYYLVLDPGYACGNIHIYEHKESIPLKDVDKALEKHTLKNKVYHKCLTEQELRVRAVFEYIKLRFGVSPQSWWRLELGWE